MCGCLDASFSVVAIVRHATDAIVAYVHRVRTRIAWSGEDCDGYWSHRRPNSTVRHGLLVVTLSLLPSFLVIPLSAI